MLTSRERVRLILNHQEADRPAIDLGSTEVTGTSAWTYRALKQALGFPPGRVRVYNMIEMLAEVEAPVLDALGVDFVMLPPTPLRFGLDYGEWKPFTFWDGQTFDVPQGFYASAREDGALLTSGEPGGPLDWCMPREGRFFDRIPSAHWDPLDVEPPARADWQFVDSIPDETLCVQQEMARVLYESCERAIVAMPQVYTPDGYGGFIWFAVQMRNDPAWCQDYLMRAAEAAARCFEQYLQAVGQYIDVVIVNLADYGMQEREWFDPELFREFFVPAWRLCTEVVHRFPHVKTFDHCCGSISHLIPYLIEAGIDCLNPVQWSARNMDLRELKARYGKELVFWGGAVNTQQTLPFGTPDQVAQEARQVLDIMCPGGGYVVNPIHNILPEVPIENVLALYQTANAYQYG